MCQLISHWSVKDLIWGCLALCRKKQVQVKNISPGSILVQKKIKKMFNNPLKDLSDWFSSTINCKGHKVLLIINK